MNLELVYVGSKVTDVRGVVTKAGTPFKLGIREFQTAIDWQTRYYSYDREELNPLQHEEDFAKIIKQEPVFVERVPTLSWSGRPNEKVPTEYFVGIAEGSFSIPDGQYQIEITSDDGVRAWLDDKPIVTDGWLHQSPTVYRFPTRLNGNHRLRIEYFQQDGYATLAVRIVPVQE